MTEHITMKFDWEEAKAPITDVLGLNPCVMTDGSACWDSVAFRLGENAVMITVEPDTDQIFVDLQPFSPTDGWESIPAFGHAVGRSFGWSWVCINYRGYKDCFAVAFGSVVPDALDPRVMFVAAASSLYCLDLAPVMAPGHAVRR
jgi:hypothetical protein